MENVPILLITVAPPSISAPSSNTPSTTLSPSFFHIHSNLLLPFSPHFTRLFDTLPDPPPGQWKALTISDIPAPIFASFVQWLYYGNKHFLVLEATAAAPATHDSTTPSFPLALAHLYVVAERYDVHELQRAVVAAVARYWSHTHAPPPSGLVEYVYANTAPESVLRRLLVEWHGLRADDWFGSQEAKQVLATVPAFAGELAMALGMWHGRGGEKLLIEWEEEGEGDESEEEEEGGSDMKAEVRERSEDTVGRGASEGSESTLPG